MRLTSGLLLSIAIWPVLLLATGLPLPTTTVRWRDAPSDTTVVDSVTAGNALIRALPIALNGDSVLSYRAIRIPALGWLRHRSFFWRTPSDAEGSYRFGFEAQLSSGAVETVFVSVIVGASEF